MYIARENSKFKFSFEPTSYMNVNIFVSIWRIQIGLDVFLTRHKFLSLELRTSRVFAIFDCFLVADGGVIVWVYQCLKISYIPLYTTNSNILNTNPLMALKRSMLDAMLIPECKDFWRRDCSENRNRELPLSGEASNCCTAQCTSAEVVPSPTRRFNHGQCEI